jgi:hypothetical protein
MQQVNICKEWRGGQFEIFLMARLYEFLENQSSSRISQAESVPFVLRIEDTAIQCVRVF